MEKKLRILFMGSPDFAATSLKKLVEDGFNVVGAITTPDRKKGRGQKLGESAVKQAALALNIPVFQPTNLKDETFLEEMKNLDLDLGIVVAFRMLPEKLWDMPRMGTMNLHASLLPDYRGAAPINWAIINGEKRTGITTFFLKHEIDTGDVLLREEVEIGPSMTAGDLHDLLMEKGAILLSRSAGMVENGEFETSSQLKGGIDEDRLKRAPKIFKDDCKVDWNQDAVNVFNLIRGLSPYPAAWSTFLTKSGKELTFKIFRAELTDTSTEMKGNNPIKYNKEELLIGASDYYLRIIELQLEGKKRMTAKDFMKGFDLSEASIKPQS